MQLSFQHPHLSIKSFPTIELPDFALIVGLNGSGKSHLLQAIVNNAVKVGAGRHPSGIRLLTNITALQQTPIIGQDQIQAGMSLQQGPPPMSVDIDSAKFRLLQELYKELLQIVGNRITEIVSPGHLIWTLTPREIVEKLRAIGVSADLAAIERIYQSASERFGAPTTHWPFPFSPTALQKIAAKVGKSVLQLSNADLAQLPHWGASDLFSANMALLCRRYRDENLKNKIIKLDDMEKGTNNALSDADFKSTFGEPPWDMLNETLRSFKLPYQVLPPEANSTDPVHLQLRKDGSGDIVEVSQLSSGETVLLSFAMATFTYDDALVSVMRPGLLLLDELDASLHPEMVQRWLGAVITGLVERQGIPVIATTHSPTTVALAPEASLFEMIDGSSGLRKISKQSALNRLTYGVPTLSIDYSGRRQVLVESDTDAAVYESTYSLIKARLDARRSLSFLSTGMRTKKSVEINSGCAIVSRLVSELERAGNDAVFGLIDWDGVNVSTQRIIVLAEGTRNGIENVLLDPLLIALLLIRHDRAPEDVEDLAERFTGIEELSVVDLQRLADSIQNKVLSPSEDDEMEEVIYLNGTHLSVRRRYLRADDHSLEEALQGAFPFLKKFTHRRGQLVQSVVKEVIRDYPSFCPLDVKVAFEAIAGRTTLDE